MSNNIRTKVIEQLDTLPENLQRQVLEFVQALQVFAQRGVPGKQLLEFAGAIPLPGRCTARRWEASCRIQGF